VKYAQFSYPCTCECGKQFYLVQQVWGMVENIEIEHNFKCLKCTAMEENKNIKSDVAKARENFTKRLEETWHNTEFKMPSNFLKDNGDPMTVLEMLIDLNYKAVRDRGLINDETDFYDFMEKLEEESEELAWAFLAIDPKNNETKKHFGSELIDCLSVLLNMAKHYNIDVIDGLKENIIKNQERAKNKQ
jgi:NTP pyrophosphatase (non-canonical NTP hydrolase)